ncbi:hypothetical protein K5D32_07170, partial [Pseudomonas cichorii]|nr:hypothetical protein [Pseudomonas cichorii]
RKKSGAQHPGSHGGFECVVYGAVTFQLINETTGEPMPNQAYAIQRADGSIEQGVSDAQGFTHRVRSNVAESVKVFVED